jgi:hypothetical protein
MYFETGSGIVDVTPKALGVAGLNLTVRANGSNTGVICVGTSEKTAADGYILGKGEKTPPVYVDEEHKVFIVGSVKGQGYSWIATR